MADRARGKRRAEPTRKKRRRSREPGHAPGRRADRPEAHEGITPEFLRQMRELEDEPVAPRPVRTGPGVREVLASIDADLRADPTYQQALSKLAYG